METVGFTSFSTTSFEHSDDSLKLVLKGPVVKAFAGVRMLPLGPSLPAFAQSKLRASEINTASLLLRILKVLNNWFAARLHGGRPRTSSNRF